MSKRAVYDCDKCNCEMQQFSMVTRVSFPIEKVVGGEDAPPPKSVDIDLCQKCAAESLQSMVTYPATGPAVGGENTDLTIRISTVLGNIRKVRQAKKDAVQ